MMSRSVVIADFGLRIADCPNVQFAIHNSRFAIPMPLGAS